ncbi:MAG TPA: hypothetical protein VET27_16765, partial [Mycobacterium sp.]|nr:hypothetical protein [Mycobacterium sp.]
EAPIPDVEAAFVLKMLVRIVRDTRRDLQDIETLLEIIASQPDYRSSPWRIDDPNITRAGERGDAARAAGADDRQPNNRVDGLNNGAVVAPRRCAVALRVAQAIPQ